MTLHFLPLPMFKKASLVSVVKASDVAKVRISLTCQPSSLHHELTAPLRCIV